MALVTFFGLLFRDLRSFGKGQRRVGRRFACDLAHSRDLCTADVEDRAVSRGFSCSNFGELLDISIAGGE